MAKPKQKRIRLKLGEFNGDKSFASLEKLREWHSEEQQHYTWVQEAARGDGNLNNLVRNLNSHFQTIHGYLRNVSVDEDGVPDENALERAKNQIETIYGNNQLIYTESPRGEFIESLRVNDSTLAAWALNYFIGPGAGISNASYKVFEGVICRLAV